MSRPVISIVNGPNLNLLGERQPLIYGTATLDDHVDAARSAADVAGFDVEHVQSNHEGVLIDAIQAARGTSAAIVVNAAAFTHSSWGIADALACFDGAVVEVHISNPWARETWRHTSVVSPVADVAIAGAGGFGYVLAVQAVVHLLNP
ncbi:MAG TPA: type II 3-dehydroquinate dehydratase [Acidimicrobiales bacterium]|nr:type II 3-dehydroquinate dehydratase [Acidimicrobiales bacterium]